MSSNNPDIDIKDCKHRNRSCLCCQIDANTEFSGVSILLAKEMEKESGQEDGG